MSRAKRHDPSSPRTVTTPCIMVRLSADEKRRIERKAAKAGHRYPAQWLRELALSA